MSDHVKYSRHCPGCDKDFQVEVVINNSTEWEILQREINKPALCKECESEKE